MSYAYVGHAWHIAQKSCTRMTLGAQMSLTYATLSLGTRIDAKTWETKCNSFGISQKVSIRKGQPKRDEVKSVFASKANWVYLGGHFTLYDGYGLLSNESGDTNILFKPTAVSFKTANSESDDGEEKRRLQFG